MHVGVFRRPTPRVYYQRRRIWARPPPTPPTSARTVVPRLVRKPVSRIQREPVTPYLFYQRKPIQPPTPPTSARELAPRLVRKPVVRIQREPITPHQFYQRQTSNVLTQGAGGYTPTSVRWRQKRRPSLRRPDEAYEGVYYYYNRNRKVWLRVTGVQTHEAVLVGFAGRSPMTLGNAYGLSAMFANGYTSGEMFANGYGISGMTLDQLYGESEMFENGYGESEMDNAA